ncbi:DNA polymerase III subunit delta [Shewanella sp. NIFS-20-20]|uniref:DNA polymerase III subunit delta n=1 Tax=Shewanella sp. NIFS-20-20 TaxID=2853806 RepID=UPI001C44E48E|nr:DNA polymerase III subunit delta [Shewanella sp. NIFS-20-20]MBV7315879.1 DNA polymerase III subunit delta [Shewanella sp. NIFS-20-20]
MRVYPEQLAGQLSPLASCYLIFGDDPWLIGQCRQQILQAAKAQGFDEHIQLVQEGQFQWAQLQQEWQSLSLFSSRRIIEITLPQAKPGTDGSQCFQQLLAEPNPDLILIVQGPKLSSDQTKSKWFKRLDSSGVYLPCQTPEGQQFNRWLTNRIKHYQLHLAPDASMLLAYLYEGNLLACDQALQLLQLLHDSAPIPAEKLHQYFDDQSRFSVFQLTDALLDNHTDKAMHMLAQLKAEGIAMPILLWGLLRELTLLLALKQPGVDQRQVFNQHRVWDKRQQAYRQALSRLSLAQIETMLAMTSKVELALKQQGHEDWILFAHICLLFNPQAHLTIPALTD